MYFCGDHLEEKFGDVVKPIDGYYHPCVSFLFSCGYLGLFLFLVVCSCIYVCCFRCLGVMLFSVCLCWWCCDSLLHNEDIVTFRCGGRELRSYF